MPNFFFARKNLLHLNQAGKRQKFQPFTNISTNQILRKELKQHCMFTPLSYFLLKYLLSTYHISASSFRRNYSFQNLTLCTVTFCHSTYRCGKYSREESIQGRKLYEEIRYVCLTSMNKQGKSLFLIGQKIIISLDTQHEIVQVFFELFIIAQPRWWMGFSRHQFRPTFNFRCLLVTGFGRACIRERIGTYNF